MDINMGAGCIFQKVWANKEDACTGKDLQKYNRSFQDMRLYTAM
jgi:hypothetical protein